MPGDFSSGARLELRITPDDVGKRVSVRQLVEITDGHPTFTDTVGVLASWDTGVVYVTPRNGVTVAIAESALVAGKVVPPAPARRPPGRAPAHRVPAATAEELEETASRAWPAVETSRLGAWTLRAAAGFTRRANSALVAGEPGVPLEDALSQVVRWYAARGLTPCLQVPDTSPYAAALDALGWVPEADTLVRTAPLLPLAELPGEGVALSRTPDAAWVAAYHRTGSLTDAALKVLSGGPCVWFASTPDGGATGRAVIDGRWALFGAVEVEPAHRRKGLATAVMGALARQAYAEGATAAYLQVEKDNDAARALCDRLGFTDHHGYHYRRP
jgi:GNAT superfamily N-acetyltransferase